MEAWKKSFVDKLHNIQDNYAHTFESTLDEHVMPAFEDLSAFVRDNGFRVSVPLKESGRRSFKFELAENAYTLVIFRFTGIGEFEVRTETFVPGADPALKKFVGRVADIDGAWALQQFQKSLDNFVDQLNAKAGKGDAAPAAQDEFAPNEDDFVSV